MSFASLSQMVSQQKTMRNIPLYRQNISVQNALLLCHSILFAMYSGILSLVAVKLPVFRRFYTQHIQLYNASVR